MKYLVNRETKEHYIQPGMRVPYGPQYDEVEADADGWIPWKGGECPLPDDCMCEVQIADGERPSPFQASWWAWRLDVGAAAIAHYRPILSTTEKEEPRRHGRTIVHIPKSQQSVFDRLKSAIAASESIPDIIAEIDALLPEGYCVVKRGAEQPAEHPAEGMADWRNWREGDCVEATSSCAGYEEGFVYIVKHIKDGTVFTKYDDQASSTNGWGAKFFRFHSRPAKVTE